MAVFLVSAGMSGALLAFHHELDEALNPKLYRVADAESHLSPWEIASSMEKQAPDLDITWLPLTVEPGHAVVLGGVAKGTPLASDEITQAFHQLFVDPHDGTLLGRRVWGECCFSPSALMPFVYRWHYTLALPGQLGVWLMGSVSVLWCLDCMVGLYLALPGTRSRKQLGHRAWTRVLSIKGNAGLGRLLFDVHRAVGVWCWALLLSLAVSATALSLPEVLVKPLLATMSTLSPDPIALRRLAPPVSRQEPALSFADIAHRAQKFAARDAWTEQASGVHCDRVAALCAVRFGDEHASGLGARWIYVDAYSGTKVGSQTPGQGSAADVFMHAQFPLHSGQIVGLPGRILVALGGVAVTVLSVSGVWLWWRKRRARCGLTMIIHVPPDAGPAPGS